MRSKSSPESERSRIGVRATTVAVRCPVRRSAISPSVSPGPRVWVDGGSVVVERDDLGTRLNLDLAHRGRKLIALRCRNVS